MLCNPVMKYHLYLRIFIKWSLLNLIRKFKFRDKMIGSEYMSNTFEAYLVANEILCIKLPSAYTLVQNDMVEWKKRHLLEVIRALLIKMNVRKARLSDGILTTTFLINQMPSRISRGKSPIQVLRPSAWLFLILPKVFGCVWFVHIQTQ